MKNVLFCSYGKDSLATAVVAIANGIKIDEAVCVEVFFDNDTPAAFPDHYDFIHNCAAPFLEKNNIKPVFIRSKKTAFDVMTTIRKRGKHVGCLVGYPVIGRCDILRDCKLSAIAEYKKNNNCIEILGIAKNEEIRYSRLKPNQRSILFELGIDEKTAFEICKDNNILSPIYDKKSRDGCFFCPCGGMKNIEVLRKDYPLLLQKLLKLDKLFAENNTAFKSFGFKYTLCQIVEILTKRENQLSFLEELQ